MEPGDGVEFVFSPNHDVQVLASEAAWEACDFAGAVIAAAPQDGAYVHYFQAPGRSAGSGKGIAERVV